MTDNISLQALYSLLEKNRSYRRFDESARISREQLEAMAGAARLTSSGRNIQALSYRLVHTQEETDRLFPCLAWAGYLKDWEGPAEGERPAAYMVQCLDTAVSTGCLCDDGLQLEALTLAAVAQGLGCCILKAFDPARVADILGITERYKPLYVVAIGVPVEKVVIDTLAIGSKECPDASNIRYWREADRTHHVPKRPLEDIII